MDFCYRWAQYCTAKNPNKMKFAKRKFLSKIGHIHNRTDHIDNKQTIDRQNEQQKG